MLEAARDVTAWGTAGEGGRTLSRSRLETHRREVLARLSVMSLVEPGQPMEAHATAHVEAGAVARAWLDLIHSGRSASSWAVTAPAFKEAIAPEEWQAALRSVRAALGRCRSRRLRSQSAFEAFPGLPPGPYAVNRFESGFEGRDGVIETVATCLGADGLWRATAYFVG